MSLQGQSRRVRSDLRLVNVCVQLNGQHRNCHNGRHVVSLLPGAHGKNLMNSFLNDSWQKEDI